MTIIHYTSNILIIDAKHFNTHLINLHNALIGYFYG